jgi:hypothetical protein
MTLPQPAAIREWHDVSPEQFHEHIVPANEPAVLRGAVRHWPAVRHAAGSPGALVGYLLRFDRGGIVNATVADASTEGRIFYNEDLSGFNFRSQPQPLADLLRAMLASLDSPTAERMYVSAVPAWEHLAGFSAENALPLLPPTVGARAWIGTRITVATHYDVMLNLACVVAGRRRFTLFPPGQLRNLYVGPLEFTPAGTPVSMVRLDAPDLVRYPRFREALAHAQSAELGPGDAIYVPYMWWHHVEALSPFNVLINYWWLDTPQWVGSPVDALIHAMYSVRSLSPEKRAVWREWFDHYIFQTGGDPVEHLPMERRGVQAPPSAQSAATLRAYLIERLTREQNAPAAQRPAP